MKLAKFFALVCATALSFGAFADAANVCITFSTQGPDKYADGTIVKDGEWYALVWLASETTEATITSDLKTTDSATSEVMLAAPLAKDEKCPLVMFQIDSAAAKSTGTYKVYMLDTRNAAGTPSASVGGVPAIVQASTATTASAAATGAGVSVGTSVTGAEASGEAVATAAAAGTEQPKITSFAIANDMAYITVSGLAPSIVYAAQSGAALDKITVTDVAFDGTKGEADIVVPAKDAKFFSVTRKPIK